MTAANVVRTLVERKTVPVGAPPHGQVVYADPLDQVWVLNTGGSSISVLDGTTGDGLATIEVGGGPRFSKFNWETGLAYVSLNSGGVAVLDARTGQVEKTLALPGGEPTSLMSLFSKHRLYVVTYDGGTHVVDTTTNELVATIPTARGCLWGTPQSPGLCGTVHIVNELANAVTLVDEDTEQIVATVAVGRRPVRNIVDYPRNTVYTANFDDDTVSAIDLATRAVVATIPAGRHPYRMAVTQKRTGRDALWVLNRGSEERPTGEITVVNVTDHQVIQAIPVGTRPSHWHSHGPIWHVLSPTDRELLVLDERERAVIGSARLSRDPDPYADNVMKVGKHDLFLANADATVSIFGDR